MDANGPPMEQSILHGTCQANVEKSPIFVPRFYWSNAAKLPETFLF